MRVAQALKERGVKVGGIVSRETQTNNVRIGFEFLDLITNDRCVLASITGIGPRVGKYFVCLFGCIFAAEQLTNAIATSDVIICDEIGPMELKSREIHRLRKEFTSYRQGGNCCCTSKVETSSN
jgi:nucleoside-triphosphatase